MCEILVCTFSKTNADPSLDKTESIKKGYPVVAKGNDHSWTAQELDTAYFVIIKAPTVSVDTAQYYCDQWIQIFEYSVLSSTTSTDTHSVNVHVSNINASGLGGPTKDNIEGYLNKWNLTVTGFGTNSVTFTAVIFNCIRSEGFLHMDPTGKGLTSTEVYTEATGNHRVTVDYSAATFNEPKKRITDAASTAGGTFVSEDDTAKTVTFDITRAAVFNAFKRDVSNKGQKPVYLRRYYFLESDVDTVISSGGSITLTGTQLNNKLQDRYLE